jgi:hypothetical protein
MFEAKLRIEALDDILTAVSFLFIDFGVPDDDAIFFVWSDLYAQEYDVEWYIRKQTGRIDLLCCPWAPMVRQRLQFHCR